MIVNHEKTSDESEVSDSSTDARTSFRVSVCLRRYFKDHRARCYMQVTRNRRVRWLEKRIQKVFSLSQRFCLCSNGHLLPSTEPLALLDPGDSIEVIPLKEAKGKDLNMINGCLNGSNVISDTTQPIILENSTLFGSEITINNATILDNENINQTSESVLDKNNTIFNINKDVDLTSHDMGNYQSESTFSFNDRKDIYEQSTYDETDGTVETLQRVKQQALHFLKDEFRVTLSEPPRRVRRRVRRRPRRTASPEASPVVPPASLAVPSASLAPAPRLPHLRFSSPPPCTQTLVQISPRSLSPVEVERNEEANARLPRVIRPLGADD